MIEKKYNDSIEELREQNKTIDDTIEKCRQLRKEESELINELTVRKNQNNFIIEMYENIDNSFFSLPSIDNKFITSPLSTIRSYGVIHKNINQHITNDLETLKKDKFLLETTRSLSWSATSSLTEIANMYPNIFPLKDKVIKDYNQSDQYNKNIDYIRKTLPNIDKTLLEDFNHLIEKLNLFSNTTSQYQDLIGARSLFFFKMIYGEVESKFGTRKKKDRHDDIRKFIFGNTVHDFLIEPIIETAYNLYTDLSSQDKAEKLSVKSGNVTANGIKILFEQLFGVIASLLQLREKYYT